MDLLASTTTRHAIKMEKWILGSKFNEIYPHKGSIKNLWELKWKFAVGVQLLFCPRIKGKAD